MILHYLEMVIPPIVGVIEFVGLFVIVLGCLSALLQLVKAKFDFNDAKTKVILVSAISLALEFLLAAEILLTVVVKSLESLLLIVGIALLRIFISYVLHWTMDGLGKQQTEAQE